MKKFLMLVLCLIMAAGCALAEPVQRAAALLETENFEHYPSWTLDAKTGRWSVHSVQTDALLDRFWTYGRSNTLAVFYLEAEGNAQTGVWSPVLKVCYSKAGDLNAKAVSILADGVRYDLAASSAALRNDRSTGEIISAPLDQQGVEAVRAMLSAENVTVRLMGDNIYTTVLASTTTNTLRQVEAASLPGLQAGMELLEAAGLETYALWDLSAAAWKQAYGHAPACCISDVQTQLRGAETGDAFGMVVYGDHGRAAIAAQEILLESGFLSGSAASTFGESAVSAVRRAQRYLGLIETGCMDAQLEAALLAGRAQEEKTACTEQTLAGLAGIGVERCWFAKGVSAKNNPESMRTVLNSDNTLLIADGCIRNLSAEPLHLFMQPEVKLLYNGTYSFDAEILCEANAGRDLDTVLLPLAHARMIVCAEIPAHLADDSSASWSLVWNAGGETAEIQLQ